MLKPVFKDGVPTCPCGSQKFNVGFKELVYHELDANKGIDGWGESESINLHNPIHGNYVSWLQ